MTAIGIPASDETSVGDSSSYRAPDTDLQLTMPRFETARLWLRPLTELDALDMAVALGNPRVTKHIGSGRPKSFEETLEYIAYQSMHDRRYGYSLWGMERKSDGRVIGQCGLWHLEGTDEIDLAYTLAEDIWGQGYATEASEAWLKLAFEGMKLDRVVAVSKPENPASLRILEKLGFQYERDDIFYGCHCRYYAINRDQWNDRKSGSSR